MKLVTHFSVALVALAAANTSLSAAQNSTAAPPHASSNITASPSEQLVNVAAAGASVCGPRIRKSWDQLLPIEKELYVRALEIAMDDGTYIKFVEIHTEQMTTAEAHRTCMFIYWHRLFLLGFENMLRSYGGDFACITVPYWNYVDHNALFLAGACRSMEDCSPILRELGGSRGLLTRTVEINGTPVEGTCVAARPCNHFCEASGLRGNQCARCLPRGDWRNTPFPPTVSVSSLLRQLFASPTIADLANNIEQGVHNTMHNSLSGAMENLEAPADPIFYSHHATLDLLHSIYYKCVIGNTAPMALDEKLADPRQFMQCPRREALARRSPDRNVLMPQSSVSIRSGGLNAPVQSVFDATNPLDAFFAQLPREYWSLSDVRDIGDFSYNYEITGLLGDMYTTCGGLTSFLQEQLPVDDSGFGGFGADGLFPSRNLRAEQTTTASTAGLVEAVVVPSKTSNAWYHEAFAAAMNATTHAEASSNSNANAVANALAEVEKMTCVFYDECRGKVQDFSTGFRQHFHTNGSSPCSAILHNIESGRDAIAVPEWRAIFLHHLQCDATV